MKEIMKPNGKKVNTILVLLCSLLKTSIIGTACTHVTRSKERSHLIYAEKVEDNMLSTMTSSVQRMTSFVSCSECKLVVLMLMPAIVIITTVSMNNRIYLHTSFIR